MGMTELFSKYGPFLIVGALCLVAWALSGTGPKFTPRVLVRAKPLVTANELEFLHRLRRALPDFEVLTQVSMGALLDADLPAGHPRLWTIRRVFSMKIVDYVVCERKTLRVVAAIELDDVSHTEKKDNDVRRDTLLASAGIPTLRWDSRSKPTELQIAERVEKLRQVREKSPAR
jgi:hypothetical protein